jgi:replication initiation protein RepC
LQAQDLLLLDTFAAFTQPQDWEQGRRPIVWASNNFLMEQTGFSLSTLRRHVRRLAELGLIWIKDSPNGKRYGHRDQDGVIVEAYGFDLAPLAARAEEFEALYAQLKEERQFCASLRNVITVTRRMIRAKIEKALESGLRGPWRKLQEEFAVLLLGLPKRTTTSHKLMDIADWFKDFKDRVEKAFEAAFEWPEESDEKSPLKEASVPSSVVLIDVDMAPTGVSSATHILTTNQPHPVNSNCFEKKHAAGIELEPPTPERVERPEDVGIDIEWSTHTKKRKSDIDIPTLMLTCPHFAEMARGMEGCIRNWDDLHRAAGKMRGMVEKARAGELHLDRSFYGRLSEKVGAR